MHYYYLLYFALSAFLLQSNWYIIMVINSNTLSLALIFDTSHFHWHSIKRRFAGEFYRDWDFLDCHLYGGEEQELPVISQKTTFLCPPSLNSLSNTIGFYFLPPFFSLLFAWPIRWPLQTVCRKLRKQNFGMLLRVDCWVIVDYFNPGRRTKCLLFHAQNRYTSYHLFSSNLCWTPARFLIYSGVWGICGAEERLGNLLLI